MKNVKNKLSKRMHVEMLTVPEYWAPGIVVSGAANAGVPAEPDKSSPDALNSALTPKSATLTRPSLSTNKLLGLISRWTIRW